EAAHVWIAEEIVSADAGDTRVADLLAGAWGIRRAGGCVYSADAEGADGDERAIGDSAERPQWSDGDEHPALDCGGRAGRQAAGGVPGSTGEGEQGNDRQEPGRD